MSVVNFKFENGDVVRDGSMDGLHMNRLVMARAEFINGGNRYGLSNGLQGQVLKWVSEYDLEFVQMTYEEFLTMRNALQQNLDHINNQDVVKVTDITSCIIEANLSCFRAGLKI
jgi:hypothetical protein